MLKTAPGRTFHSPYFQQFLTSEVKLRTFFMAAAMGPPTMVDVVELVSNGKIAKRDFEAFEETDNAIKLMMKNLTAAEFLDFCREFRLSRCVETFNQYLTNMLLTTFLQRPEILKSSETVKLSDLLSWGQRDEIVRKLAEKKVDALSYQSFDDLVKYLQDTLGLPLTLDSKLIETAREAIELRNLSVHNSLIVNSTFLRRTKRKDLNEGEKFILTTEHTNNLTDVLKNVAEKLDQEFLTHFKLIFN